MGSQPAISKQRTGRIRGFIRGLGGVSPNLPCNNRLLTRDFRPRHVATCGTAYPAQNSQLELARRFLVIDI